MFEAFRDFLRSIGSDPSGAGAYEADRAEELRLAAAALLFHVGAADGVVTDEELALLQGALSREFGLSADEAERLATAGQAADREAVDLFQFTSVLKNGLDEAARVRFVEILWEVTFVDGAVHELEDNIIWRVADLLGVSTRERMLMKRRAAGGGDG